MAAVGGKLVAGSVAGVYGVVVPGGVVVASKDGYTVITGLAIEADEDDIVLVKAGRAKLAKNLMDQRLPQHPCAAVLLALDAQAAYWRDRNAH